MTYDEVRTRWRTENVIQGTVHIANDPDCPDYKKPMWECRAGLGDLIRAYIDHKAIPWWRRRYDWGLVEKMLRERLDWFMTMSWPEL